MKFRMHILALAALLASPVAIAQDNAPADAAVDAALMEDMHALERYVGPGKRGFVEEQLALTTEQADRFWPIYESHQSALQRFNERRLEGILAYAHAYDAGNLDDATATALARAMLDLERDEARQMEHVFNKLRHAIPAVKAARYLQVENKLRAIVRFEQAARVPYAE